MKSQIYQLFKLLMHINISPYLRHEASEMILLRNRCVFTSSVALLLISLTGGKVILILEVLHKDVVVRSLTDVN